jgi:hypothetical protein
MGGDQFHSLETAPPSVSAVAALPPSLISWQEKKRLRQEEFEERLQALETIASKDH